MAKLCEGRVCLVTGAGRGIGREHALMLAEHGAKVVVNDLGGDRRGDGGEDDGPAHQVVAEIVQAGGEAVADGGNVADFAEAKSMVDLAIESYGRLDVVINNAGILRDRMLVNMTFDEWDAVIRVHLRGTFATSHHAANHWRDRSKAGDDVAGRIINTSSPSGIYGNVGQTNYGAAKAGIASFTIIAAMELARYGVTVNAIAPVAATRMTIPLQAGGAPTVADGEWSPGDPGNIAPLVVWLGSREAAGVTGRVFNVRGDRISVAEGWHAGEAVEAGRRWDPVELGEIIPGLVERAQPNADMSGRLPD